MTLEDKEGCLKVPSGMLMVKETGHTLDRRLSSKQQKPLRRHEHQHQGRQRERQKSTFGTRVQLSCLKPHLRSCDLLPVNLYSTREKLLKQTF